MAITKKPKRISYTTPKGVFKFPSLSKPDFGNESFPKPDGEFKVAVVVPLELAQPLIDKLMPEWNIAIALGHEAFGALALPVRKKLGALKEQMFYETEYDPDTEEETGNVIFKFKTKYKITDKKTGDTRFNTIGLFDASSPPKPLAPGVAIYGGTVGKISFQVADYFVAGQGMAGLSLRLGAAQVIDLVGPGNRSASSFGFGGEEGGYETEEADSFPPEESAGAPKAAPNGDPSDF